MLRNTITDNHLILFCLADGEFFCKGNPLVYIKTVTKWRVEDGGKNATVVSHLVSIRSL